MAIVACFVLLGVDAPPSQPRFIPTLEDGDAVPPIALIAQDERPFSFADLRGNAVLVSFIYTRCRDPRMCPLVAAKFARMQHAIGSAPIRLVLITLDPAYDTPPVLQRYGHAFGQDPRYWTLGTGSGAAIDELAGRLGIASAATAPGVTVHTDAAVVIGPDGRLARTIFGNAWSSAELIDAAQATLGGRDDPAARLRAWLNAAIERCGGGGLALSGGAMFGIFAAILLCVAGAFGLAFRDASARKSGN